MVAKKKLTQMIYFLKNTLFASLLVAAFSTALLGQQEHWQLQKADRLYDKKEYRKAEDAYRQSASGHAASYNAGNAAYQQGRYADAADMFKKAVASAPNVAVKADAFYNLGNALLQQGKYAEAVAAYENSLRKQPTRADAKKNLQIAKKKLKEQENPPPPPPPQKPPPPPPPAPNPRRNYLDRAQQSPQKEPPSGSLSPEAARRLLETTVALEEEKNARQYRELSPAAKPSKVRKDW